MSLSDKDDRLVRKDKGDKIVFGSISLLFISKDNIDRLVKLELWDTYLGNNYKNSTEIVLS